MRGFLPEKSTKAYSPARCTWRSDTLSFLRHSRYRSQKWRYWYGSPPSSQARTDSWYSTFGEHEHASGIDAQVRLAIGVLEHRFDEWICELGKPLVPGAERRLGEIERLASIDALDVDERPVTLPAAYEGVGERRRAGQATLDGVRGEHLGRGAALAICAPTSCE
jgi:hypothetical protein